MRHRVRVVKEVDLKSTGLCPRKFESCRCRFPAFLFAALSIRNCSPWSPLLIAPTSSQIEDGVLEIWWFDFGHLGSIPVKEFGFSTILNTIYIFATQSCIHCIHAFHFVMKEHLISEILFGAVFILPIWHMYLISETFFSRVKKKSLKN